MEAGHRYILEPYSGPGSRHTCPECGRKGAFVRYIDTETGEQLADNVGRCNREDSCGYHYKPRDYFRDHPGTGQPFQPTLRTKPRPIVRPWTPPPPLESYTIPAQLVKNLYAREAQEEAGKMPSARRWPFSHLFQGDQLRNGIEKSAFRSCAVSSYLAAFLRDQFGADAFQAIVRSYHLGSWRGAAVFWYIDSGRRIRTGKAMYYLENGHRNKNYNPFYMHPIISAHARLAEGWKLRRCLFGEHLLQRNPAAPVALVESEKTALICAALCPGPVWLAAGGKHYLNADTCAALKGRSVIAYPDLGAFDEWQLKLSDISKQAGFAVEVSPLLEGIATAQERAAGLDIADYLLQDRKAGNGPKTGIDSKLKTTLNND